MAFDKSTRNRLARFVSDARRLIAEEFTEQFQSIYGISPKGDVTPLDRLQHLDEEGLATAAMLRERIDYLIKTHPDERDREWAAVDRLARELAFTVLNRLAALRMAEARDLIIQSVGKGYDSKGFQLFKKVAGAALGDSYHCYRRYLFCLFDELAIDLGILFDRNSPQAILFPREPALLELLSLINHHEIDPLWAEDETIGWIYQYYNDEAERKKMREESAAPRNSRELAVRNQFFTPRYVVEFLTDNTLGLIWYEMTQGQTRLKDQCRYMVRRPSEVFLKEGEIAPEIPTQEGLTQEEILKQTVYIPRRPVKDPREIRLLDPACGSMHFGLYAFDLYEVIYEEAWHLGVESLRRDFPEKDSLLRQIPRLIIENNIHGIDIDPRAVQIAGLSLWLRAQRAWHDQGVKAADRPRITRGNIVCAEPMPGSPEMLEEFCITLKLPVLGELVKSIFEKMELAGEAGFLLKIEEEIRSSIDAAKQVWEKILSRPRELFSTEDLNKVSVQTELTSLEKSLSSGKKLTQDFWESAEEQLLGALKRYAEQAESEGVQKRLFAHDAAKGFAFVDLCRNRYDAVVMNPPFGEPSAALLKLLDLKFAEFNNNLLCAFLFQAYEMRSESGKIGSIFDRTAIVKNTYEKFRRRFFVADDRLDAHCDLGWDVLDANVEVTSSVLGENRSGNQALFFDARPMQADKKEIYLMENIISARKMEKSANISISAGSSFSRFPNAVLGYDFPSVVKQWFERLSNFGEQGVQVLAGHTILADRYFRYWWEVPLSDAFRTGASWQRLYNGGDYSRFSSPLCDAVLYGKSGALIQEHKSTILRNPRLQQTGSLGFGKRGEFIDAHVLPRDFVSSVEGQAVVMHGNANAAETLALLNSTLFQAVVNLYCGQHKYPGYVHLFPCPEWSNEALRSAGEAAMQAFRFKEQLDTSDETHPRFLNSESFRMWTSESSTRFTEITEKIFRLEEQMNKAISRAYPGIENAENFLKPYKLREPKTGGVASEQPSRFISESRLLLCLGITYGRWDIRYITSERQSPELLDPFDPLPVCPPGMLQSAEGLPADPKEVPAEYPLRISWTGILVDDENHPEDIVARVREAIEMIWKDRAEAMEQEACNILGIKSLREYFRRPSAFFADHLSRYSKSRRQAPIYWPLSTKSGTYTLWLYYPRLTDQTLHTCLADFLDPKIRNVQLEIESLRESGRNAARLGELQEFLDELKDFHDEIEEIIKLPWKPNLNDGVLITAAPLWKLFRLPKWQKDLKACWEKLQKGEYDWGHLALSIWPDRVKKVCEKDRSIAIAHGLEHLCKVEPPKPKAGRKKKAEVEEIAD